MKSARRTDLYEFGSEPSDRGAFQLSILSLYKLWAEERASVMHRDGPLALVLVLTSRVPGGSILD